MAQSCDHKSTSSNSSVDNNTFESTYTQSKALSQPLSNCNNSVIDEGSQLCHNNTSISNNVTSSMFESTLPLENSLSQPVSKSSKWNKYSAVVNARRRQLYKVNPSMKWYKSLFYYHSQPNIRSVRQKYYKNNSSPIKHRKLNYYYDNKHRVLSKYHCNPSPVIKKSLKRYHSDPSPIKRKIQERYYANPSPIKEHAKLMYKANSSTINLRKRQAYTANPDVALIRGKAYYKNNSYSIRNKTLKAYYHNHQLNKERRRQGYIKSVHKVLDKRRIARLVVGSICKKYNKIRATLPSFTTRCISLVVKKMNSKTLAGKHLSAEHLVKTSLYYRETYQREFVKAFQHLRSSVLASLSKASEFTTGDPSKIQGILCGESLHTSNTELFFPEVCYHDNAFDGQKKVMYHKFPSYTTDAHKTGFTTWKCSNLCNTTASHILGNLMDIYSKIGECLPLMARRYVQQIDECNKRVIHDANLQGHSKDCYLDPQACGSPLLFLRRLAPHYPAIRKLVNMLYEVRRADAKISVLDRALYRGDVSALQNIVKEQKETRKLYMLGDNILDESIILKSKVQVCRKKSYGSSLCPAVQAMEMSFGFF